MRTQPSKLQTLAGVFILAILTGCGEGATHEPEHVPHSDSTSTSHKPKSGAAGNVLQYSGQIFSIPSPVQAAMLIRQAKGEFDPNLINAVENRSRYVSRFQKALNLGVYGADLGYLSSFDRSARHLEYLGVIRELSNELDVNSQVEPDLIVRFSENIERPDSLYKLNADLYKVINQYLQENEQNETASLILAGGWIESLWLSVDGAMKNEAIRTRVGQQRSGLFGLIKLLEEYEDERVEAFRSGLIELGQIYDNISFSYTFVEPITDPAQKTTYLRSTSEVQLSDDLLAQIKAKVAEIRNTIIL